MKYLLFIPLFILLWIVFDIVRALLRKKVPARPSQKKQSFEGDILARLGKGEEISDKELIENIEPTLTYIDGRFDCSDFRLIKIMRLYLQFGDKLPQPLLAKIRDTILNFKYWMDEPGKDSMCFWSENHQILFAACEYLAGQTFPDETFNNDGKTGKEHMEKAAKRIEIWMELRYTYGFSEWYSNVYYVEDLAPMSNIIEFARDEELKLKMNIIMDIFWFDVATHSFKGAFVSTSGRMHSGNKISSDKGNSLRDAITFLWPQYPVGKPENNTGMLTNFLLNKEYEMPSAIKNIMTDETEQIILASNGISVWEMKDDDLIGQSTKQIMIQFGKEAFSSPELLANTVKYLSKNHMLNNSFLYPFGFFNIGFFRLFGLLGPISKMVKSPSDTVALNRANVYTYRTKDYIMATAQQYGTGTCAFQQHIFSATMHPSFSLFTTWPTKLSDEGSPSFIRGSFRLPHAFQHKNVAVMLYDLTAKRHFEKKPLDYTHAFFPVEFMDEHVIEDNFAFCKKGDSYAAIIGASTLGMGPLRDENLGNFELTQPYELKQYGDHQYWIFELSSLSEDGSFENFIQRIKSNKVKFDNEGKRVAYLTKGDEITVVYKEKVMVNGKAINTEYKRFDSAYAVAQRKAEEIVIECDGAKLTLNQKQLIRRMTP